MSNLKIYTIKVESNIYQSVFPEIEENRVLEYMTFDCIEKPSEWSKIEWFVFNPKKKAGNFFSLGSSGALVFDEEVFNSDLYTLIEMSGQVLPIKLQDYNLYVLNITECINALNQKDTVRDIYEDGSQGRILEYSFNRNRFSESSLFKIPETSKSEILTYSGLKSPEDEFKTLYEQLGFEGLIFQEIFNTGEIMGQNL